MKFLFDNHTGLRAIRSKLSGLPTAYIQTPISNNAKTDFNRIGLCRIEEHSSPEGIPLEDFIRRTFSLLHPSATLCCAQDDVILSAAKRSRNMHRYLKRALKNLIDH